MSTTATAFRFFFAASLGCAAAAQAVPYDKAVVVADTGTTPATLALEVDLQNGTYTVLPSFSTDVHPPLAIASDPIDRTVLVALDTGSATQVMRRVFLPTPGESLVGTVPGRAVELLVHRTGDVVVVTGGSGGAIHRLPRQGGAPVLLRNTPRAGAAASTLDLAWTAVVGRSGSASPAADPTMASVDLDGGSLGWGPITFPGFTPAGIVGLVDLPTAMPNQILAHDDGSLSVYSWFLGGNPIVATVVPALPPGGVAAMKTHELSNGLLLGGVANPNLYAFDPTQALTGTVNLTMVAGPLLGAPVDYTVLPLDGAEVLEFGRPCGVAAEMRIDATPGQGPVIGNAGFGIRLHQALPSLPAWLGLGFDETSFTMPTGCPLLVTLDAIGAQWTDGAGDATLQVPLPNDLGLVGVRFYCQWLQADSGVPFMTSDLVVVELGL